jgi:hypothetical protein
MICLLFSACRIGCIIAQMRAIFNLDLHPLTIRTCRFLATMGRFGKAPGVRTHYPRDTRRGAYETRRREAYTLLMCSVR